MKIICSRCESEIDIVSIQRTNMNEVEIFYICPGCGCGKKEIHYLYE